MTLRRELAKLRALFPRQKPVDDLAEEIHAHLAMEEQDNLERGMAPDEAHYAALRQFGNVTLAQERSGEVWRWNSLEILWRDVRFVLRMLFKNPGFTAVVVLSLALGIGANTAIFSLMNAVMLRKLPVRNPEQLVQPARVGASWGAAPSFSYPSFQRFRDQNHVFAGILAASTLYGGVDAEVGGEPESVAGELVTGNFFALLGVNPYRGRVFTPQDEGAAGSNPIVVISYGYWKRRFGLDPTALGKAITLHGTPFTIIGITPPGFQGVSVGHPSDLYVPVTMQPVFTDGKSWLNQQQFHWLQMVGRLKPGVNPRSRRAPIWMSLIARQWQRR